MCTSRDLLSHEVDARGDGTRTLQRSSALKAGQDACFGQDWTRATSEQLGGSCRPTLVHRRTRRQPPTYTRWLPLRLTNLKPHVSRCSVQRSRKEQVKLSPPTGKTGQAHGEGESCWWRNRAPVDGATRTLPAVGRLRRVVQRCCVTGLARGLRQWSHTRRRRSGPQRRLPHRTEARRRPNQDSECHSPAPASCAPSRWREVLVKLAERCVDRTTYRQTPNLGHGTPDAAALIVRIVWA